ncbi:MAG: DUF4863 family protein [Rhodocyclaceae bacterium]|nr:MAG: DUF4863 family protein [Rhodocyclaceae bacterium]
MSPEQFSQLVSTVTAAVDGKAVDKALEKELNEKFPADGPVFAAIKDAIKAGVAAGWMCSREHGGIKYGRVAKPGPELHGCSIDVVDMADLAGPHHIHPKGEIDLILPMEGDAKFDGHGAGWLVYGPGSGHRPTVSEGRAYVLYLLPDGAIEFSK